jgi:hypothetical protein
MASANLTPTEFWRMSANSRAIRFGGAVIDEI